MAPHDTSTSIDQLRFPEYRAWSERDRRWISLTFDQYQAWLTRPDLDPGEFASGKVAS